MMVDTRTCTILRNEESSAKKRYPFRVVSLHYSRECNLSCPFCYRRKQETTPGRPFEFFIDLIPYIKQLTPQIALGGGEPLLHPDFVIAMGRACTENGIVLNVTTNGRSLLSMQDSKIIALLHDVSMLSISFDHFKWANGTDAFVRLVSRLQRLVQVMMGVERARDYGSGIAHPRDVPVMLGVNMLVDKGMFKDGGRTFAKIACWLLAVLKVDALYVLYPKSSEFIDILQARNLFIEITNRFPNFFVDDLTRKIIDAGYPPWSEPCHHGKDMISIDELGGVSGCSFDTKTAFTLNEPRDILQAINYKFEPQLDCPFFWYGENGRYK